MTEAIYDFVFTPPRAQIGFQSSVIPDTGTHLRGICQLVLMDIDATYRNVGGIFYANKQSILKKKNS